MKGSLRLVVSAEFDAFVDPAAASSEAAQREGLKLLRARHQHLMLSSVFEKLASFCLAGGETSEVPRCSRVAVSVFGRLVNGYRKIPRMKFRQMFVRRVCALETHVRTYPRSGLSPSERNE
jgi:hypothetical protein